MSYPQHSNTEKITVDVVIPVYNGEKFILDAISSIASQTFPASKIIIIDDGSTDSTPELIEEFVSKNLSQNILYHRKENGGLSSARNAGIKLSSSNYLAFLDADDIWLPTKLERQISRLLYSVNPSDLGVVYCDFTLINEMGALINCPAYSNIIKSVKGHVYEKLLLGNYVSGSGSAVLVRRDCFEKCGFFDELLPSCEDWDMWLRISRHFSFTYVDEKLVKIRRHDNGMQKDNLKMILGHTLLFNKLYICGDLPKRNILSLRAQMHYANIICSNFMNNQQVDQKFKLALCSGYTSIACFFFIFARRLNGHISALRYKIINMLKGF